MPIGSFTSNRNINATTPHATPITVCQRPPRRRPLHPGPAVVACRKSLARKESRRGLSHPRSSPHTQRIAESKRAAPNAVYNRGGIPHGVSYLRRELHANVTAGAALPPDVNQKLLRMGQLLDRNILDEQP